MYRKKKLLDYARHVSCQYCGADDGTIVAAHINDNSDTAKKGTAIKAHDCLIAYLCVACHDLVDGRRLPNMEQKYREMIWRKAHHKTIQLLIKRQMLDREAMEILEEYRLI